MILNILGLVADSGLRKLPQLETSVDRLGPPPLSPFS
jgi:hypothetical protein